MKYRKLFNDTVSMLHENWMDAEDKRFFNDEFAKEFGKEFDDAIDKGIMMGITSEKQIELAKSIIRIANKR